MPTIDLTQFAVLDLDDGAPIVLGSRDVPRRITVDGDRYEVRDTIAVSTTLAVWTAGGGGLSDFDFLWIESDLDGTQVQLVTDYADDVGNEFYVVTLKAGVPLILAADDGRANYTIDWGGGSADVIDKISIRNQSATLTTKVRCVLVT